MLCTNMVQLWDDLFAVAEKVGLHILLTPYDTFFIGRRWQYHPYNRANGGPCTRAFSDQVASYPAAAK